MIKHTSASLAAVIAACSGLAQAGGFEGDSLPIDQLFVEGNNLNISGAYVKAYDTGRYADALGGGNAGKPYDNFVVPRMSYKHQWDENWSSAVMYNQPYLLKADYKQGAYAGQKGEINSDQLTFLARYQMENDISVYGGIRMLKTDVSGELPSTLVPGGYSLKLSDTTDYGYVLGAAYQIPNIALLASLTYTTAIKQKFSTTETSILGTAQSKTTIEMPKSVTLDFETGVAADTLLFASIRWVEWKESVIAPEQYQMLFGEPLNSHKKNIFTYTLGLGHQLDENWSLAALASYEGKDGGGVTALATTDGYKSLGGIVSYSTGPVTLSAGLDYYVAYGGTDELGTRFKDEKGVTGLFSLDYNF
ncbi:hypothetical protein [Parendozoicomonas haliclonae]|uniref:Outer membrane protein transport protein (OMPP1/FadL/TodX) n=1 Tax=Parendozoicomonas haliclonae TaxID=1960125 RepID=A0A1X7AM66_9GAMM|nr:hypothetical protein [Parendozoicomonas haliclonae]SMA47032.1 Outer membrane protein transport protein (OMPP1/FadL/TodX) [Parendozoicomonas haliclonae]